MHMTSKSIFCAGQTPASRFAYTYLLSSGLPITDSPRSDTGHILLDVPSFSPGGSLRGGGDIGDLLSNVPTDVTLYGGNLQHPALKGYRTVDFLKDEAYLATNAYITAECALDVALPCLSVTIRECPVLIIGWGRIGKCLAQLLQTISAEVTVAARKASDRGILQALGYNVLDTASMEKYLAPFRLVYNTVPHPVLSREQCRNFRKDCILIDLASTEGIDCEDVIIARGLPGIHFPESSGKHIAKTFLKYYKEEAE